jgi:hypothetical protein
MLSSLIHSLIFVLHVCGYIHTLTFLPTCTTSNPISSHWIRHLQSLSLESAIDLDRAHRAAAGDLFLHARIALYITLYIPFPLLSVWSSFTPHCIDRCDEHVGRLPYVSHRIVYGELDKQVRAYLFHMILVRMHQKDYSPVYQQMCSLLSMNNSSLNASDTYVLLDD